MSKYISSILFVVGLTCILTIIGCGSSPAVPAPTPTAKIKFTPLTPPQKDDTIILHYNERVPYMSKKSTEVVGLTASPAAAAFRKADIPFRWQETPSNRQLAILQKNSGQDCLLGWFRNPEREKFAKYTASIYQDKPPVILTWVDNPEIHANDTIEDILSNPNIALLVKDGYSYGKYLDAKIAEFAPKKEVTTGENITMLRMIHEHRVDFFFITPEEIDPMINSSGFPRDDFDIIQFSDMPAGENRYIICSFQVDDAIIERLNAAISQLS